jgi:hypothetical protein
MGATRIAKIDGEGGAAALGSRDHAAAFALAFRQCALGGLLDAGVIKRLAKSTA